MKKIYIILKEARQINGDYVFHKVEKVFTDKQKAENLVNNMAKHNKEIINGVTCYCDVGVIEADLEEE